MQRKIKRKKGNGLLKSADRKPVETLIGKSGDARVVRRAIVLRAVDRGLSESLIQELGIARERTTRHIRSRYKSGGLEAALYDKVRSGKPPTVTAKKTQRIVAIACSPPPDGHARWTLDLLRDEAQKTGILKEVSREKIRIILLCHDLKPWREQMWCVPKLNEEYITRMEDVLAVYEKPYNPSEPVICLDEKPVQLLDHSRDPQPMRPGKIARKDYEYKRNGTVNVFRAVEPKAGRHFTKVTPTRKKPEFASFLKSVVAKYPNADKIHLVMDNLSSHTERPLIEKFGEKEGRRIWGKLVVHYTPKHASWLNQAEIGIGIYARQCLGKDRIASIEELTLRSKAWNKWANHKKIRIDWQFTRKKARQKFGYKTGKD